MISKVKGRKGSNHIRQITHNTTKVHQIHVSALRGTMMGCWLVVRDDVREVGFRDIPEAKV